MLPIPRRSSTRQQRQQSSRSNQSNRLIRELGFFEKRLQEWISSSEKNAHWFRRDPLGAMRAAGLDIDDELLCELQTIMGGLARKLKS